MRKKWNDLMEHNVTWGGYLKLCGWSFAISMIVWVAEMAYWFNWPKRIKEFFSKDKDVCE